jgi:D-tyrosyl-tRNA(Tyr) deacylase
MNLSVQEVGGALLVVSQFTLLADCRKGRRPSFTAAAPPAEADRLYQVFVARLRSAGLAAETGVFQAHMQVHLVNDGPVTVILDTKCG